MEPIITADRSRILEVTGLLLLQHLLLTATNNIFPDDSSQAGGYSRRDRDSYYGGKSPIDEISLSIRISISIYFDWLNCLANRDSNAL